MFERSRKGEHALLIQPHAGGRPDDGLTEEFSDLARSAGATVAALLTARIDRPNPYTLIGEQDRGVVLRFGQYVRTMQPGPNFKFPWPIESVTKVNATGVRTFSNSLPVLTRDENIITVSFNVQYRVGDPQLFLFGTTDATRVLEQTAQSAVREVIGRSDLDAALNNRGPLSATAGTALQASLEAYRTGLVVTELSLQDARPPEAVKPAFD